MLGSTKTTTAAADLHQRRRKHQPQLKSTTLLYYSLLVAVCFCFASIQAWTTAQKCQVSSLSFHHRHCSGLSRFASNSKRSLGNSDDDSVTAVHLLSLKRSDSIKGKNVWRWKDAVLGDGRDFFVPKPKTLKALNQFLLSNLPQVRECCIISNCARFEVLLVVNNSLRRSDQDDVPMLEHQVARCIFAQVQSHASYQDDLWSKLLFVNLDRPEAIDLCADALAMAVDTGAIQWNHLEGIETVTRHLCIVAAGMAPRPNRPTRPVPFRPFNSRDAHVMLQLKRTSKIAQEYPTLKTILDIALIAGKAARDSKQVPEIEALRSYGSGSSRYATDIPTHLSKTAADAALERAIEPAVQQCVMKFKARSHSDTIVQLRRLAEKLSEDPEDVQWIKQQLHQPTMDLRNGLYVDQNELFVTLQSELHARRQSNATLSSRSTS